MKGDRDECAVMQLFNDKNYWKRAAYSVEIGAWKKYVQYGVGDKWKKYEKYKGGSEWHKITFFIGKDDVTYVIDGKVPWSMKDVSFNEGSLSFYAANTELTVKDVSIIQGSGEQEKVEMPPNMDALMADSNLWYLSGATLNGGVLRVENSRNTNQNNDQRNYARLKVPLQRPLTVHAELQTENRDECAEMQLFNDENFAKRAAYTFEFGAWRDWVQFGIGKKFMKKEKHKRSSEVHVVDMILTNEEITYQYDGKS